MNIGGVYSLEGKIETEALSVVVAQIPFLDAQNQDDLNKNLENLLKYMDKASVGFPGFDLFVAPEECIQGTIGSPYLSIDLDGPEVKKLKEKCIELKIWGIFDFLVQEGEHEFLRNIAIMINDKGEIVHKYTKMNPWIPGEYTYPGSECPVTPGPKGSKIATIICADGDYPEIWREAAYNGANVIVRVSAYMAPFQEAATITNRACAYCNQVYVIYCNRVGTPDDNAYTFYGNSSFTGPDGNVYAEAPPGATWLFKANVYPGIIDHMRKQSPDYNFSYQYRHRGASCPDFKGVGDLRNPYKASDY